MNFNSLNVTIIVYSFFNLPLLFNRYFMSSVPGSQDPNKNIFDQAKEREIKRPDQNSGELGTRKVVKQMLNQR